MIERHHVSHQRIDRTHYRLLIFLTSPIVLRLNSAPDYMAEETVTPIVQSVLVKMAESVWHDGFLHYPGP